VAGSYNENLTLSVPVKEFNFENRQTFDEVLTRELVHGFLFWATHAA